LVRKKQPDTNDITKCFKSANRPQAPHKRDIGSVPRNVL
jgi:hypothetical protein